MVVNKGETMIGDVHAVKKQESQEFPRRNGSDDTTIS